MASNEAMLSEAADVQDLGRVTARTQLTVMITDLELAHRILARLPPGCILDAGTHAALVEITDDALRSSHALAAWLNIGRHARTGAPPSASVMVPARD